MLKSIRSLICGFDRCGYRICYPVIKSTFENNSSLPANFRSRFIRRILFPIPMATYFFICINMTIITESHLNHVFIMYHWDVYLIVCLFAFRLIFLRVRLSSSPRSDSLYCPNPFVISRTFKNTLLSWHTKEHVKPYAERGVHSYLSIRTFPKVYVRVISKSKWSPL